MAEENSDAVYPSFNPSQDIGLASRPPVNDEALQRINGEVHDLHEPYNSNTGDGITLQDGEGCVAAKASRKMKDVKKGSCNEETIFKCNICLDLAKEPIVTSCGHLFCWPCIYQWLNMHSNSKNCPVCKRDVILENVTPIYGRGTNASVREDNDSDLGIPSRPQARRIENLSETLHLNGFPLPVQEVLLRTGGIDILTQYLSQLPESNNARREQAEMATSLLRMFMTPRGIRNVLNFRAPHDDDGRGDRNQEHPPSSSDASREPGVDSGDYQDPRRNHLD